MIQDKFSTGDGELTFFFGGHSAFYMVWNDYVIYNDPVSEYADFSSAPKADLVLISHDHYDHFHPGTLKKIEKKETRWVVNPVVKEQMGKGDALKNGDEILIHGIRIEAVPAYNTVNTQFHPRGRDNGYILTLGALRIYISGDCEDMPEMAELKNIDIAFIPVNQPYTMKVDQALHASRMIKPKILYPYHTGDTNLADLKTAFQDEKVDLRIRPMQ
jgi:L-ascorbate metabolism protein UlaG (beta-lactamase superfamily)